MHYPGSDLPGFNRDEHIDADIAWMQELHDTPNDGEPGLPCLDDRYNAALAAAEIALDEQHAADIAAGHTTDDILTELTAQYAQDTSG